MKRTNLILYAGTEYYDTNSCVTQGSYDVEYELRGSPVSILECPANRGSEVFLLFLLLLAVTPFRSARCLVIQLRWEK